MVKLRQRDLEFASGFARPKSLGLRVNFSLGAAKIEPEDFARLAEQEMDILLGAGQPAADHRPAQVREILELAV